MNPNREELLFQLALTKPAADRASWLDRECGDDKALHARLDALLAAQEQPETLLATQADTARPTIKLDLADDLHQATSFGERTPPMVWSAYTETADLSVAKALLARGLNVNETTGHGHTALDWAMKRGETPLVAYLRSQGATNSPPVARERAFPKNAIPADPAERTDVLRDTVQRAVEGLQRSSDGFLANGFVKQSGCVSCHHQTVPTIAFGRARERGLHAEFVVASVVTSCVLGQGDG